MELKFRAEIIEWRGPAPFFFMPLPEVEAREIARVAKSVSYGWGVIPVEATINGIAFKTSLFPRDGTYLLPLKVVVRKRLGLTVGDTADVSMALGR